MIPLSQTLLALGLTLQAAGPRLVIDGAFDDWDRTVTPIAAPATGAILGTAAALWNPDALYLAVRLNEVRNLQSMPGTLAVVLLPGPDARYRAPYRGRDAVYVLEFSPPNAGRGRFGARMRAAERDGWQSQPERLAGSGVLSAPTFSSDRFEIRIPRDLIPAGAAALTLAYWDERRPVEWSTAVGLSAIASAPAPGPRARPALARPVASALRILSWNVGGEGFERHLGLLATVVSRWRIDLLLLDEVPPGIDTGLRAALPPDWSVVAGTSGGRQRGILAARHPLRPVPEFAHLAYPPAALKLLERDGTRFMRDDLRAARAEGVAAAAAVMSLAGREWLLITVDLHCCGRDGGVEDRMRIYQAGVVRGAAERAAAALPGLAGVLLGGDLNLVGSRTPLQILAGAGSPGQRLVPVPALQLDGLSNHTWGRPGDPFPPGRLDFVLHSAALEPVNALVLDPADLCGEREIAAALPAASDHHPLIVDFSVAPAAPERGGSSRSGDR